MGPLRAAILEQHPHLHPEDSVCYSCTSKFRTAYIQEVLSKEKGELSKLEESVLEMLHDQELQMQSLLGTEEEHLTLGDRIADQVAAFGGSWRFILLFGSVLLLWVVVNSVPVLFKPFDPYPFILMNLFLSLVAAMQAPVIMMSQNRVAARDRLQAERDFRTNLMAELEIRQLHPHHQPVAAFARDPAAPDRHDGGDGGLQEPAHIAPSQRQGHQAPGGAEEAQQGQGAAGRT